MAQRIPSIGLSDDSSGSDSESLEVVFSRRVSGKPSLGDLPVLPTTRSANPASGVESLEGKASEQDPKAADLEAEDGVAGRIECSYGGAGHAGKATPAVGPSSSTCCAKPEGQAACRTGVAEGRVPGGEQKSTHLLLDEDNPLGVPPLTMEGWLSGAAGRLASQRNFARKTADGELYDGAADEEDQEGDAMAVAQAESAFHAVISRPVEDVVAEEVASLGTPGGGSSVSAVLLNFCHDRFCRLHTIPTGIVDLHGAYPLG